MSLSLAEIETVLSDLRPRLEGGRIERIDQPDPHRLVLSIRNGGHRYWLLLCVHPRFSRLQLLTRRPDEGKPAAGFCNVVRQHLTGAPIESVTQVRGDRVVRIAGLERDRMMQRHRVTLVAELTGIGSNLLLLDEDERVLGMLFGENSSRRKLAPGLAYTPLPVPDSLPPQAHENRFAGAAEPGDGLALARAIQSAYAELEAAEALTSAREQLLGLLRSARRRARRRRRRLRAELERADAADELRRQGELLKAALPGLHRGQDEAVVRDWFAPGAPEVTIPLEPALTPEQNMERLFARYKKARDGRDDVVRRAADTDAELKRLDALCVRAEAAGNLTEVRAAQEEARAAGVRPAPERRKRRPGKRRGPRRFVSADGADILVARTSRENERLTFTIARGNDWWMHLLGWPGPHVVVRHRGEEAPSRQTLVDAAHLAVHYSKIRDTDFAQVAYTQCKHVRKDRHGGPGAVHYSSERTLRLQVDRRRVARLMRERPEDD